MTPMYFRENSAAGFAVYSGGYLNYGGIIAGYGVRPAISLAPGTKVSDGNGSQETPYEVFLPMNKSKDE